MRRGLFVDGRLHGSLMSYVEVPPPSSFKCANLVLILGVLEQSVKKAKAPRSTYLEAPQ